MRVVLQSLVQRMDATDQAAARLPGSGTVSHERVAATSGQAEFAPPLSDFRGRSRPVAEVPLLGDYSSIPHHVNNPVQRPVPSSPTIKLLDLERERGYLAVRKAKSLAVEKEYEHLAPAVSYLFDAFDALEVQSSAADIPQTRRESLRVAVGAVGGALEYLVAVRDLLMLRGEEGPATASLVESALRGLGPGPIVSTVVREKLSALDSGVTGQLAKLLAKSEATQRLASVQPRTGDAGGSGASGSRA